MNFEGKVAFVTGGASGIGKAVVSRVLTFGARAVIFDMNENHIQAAKTELEAKHDNAEILCIAGDISKPDDLKDAYQQTQDTFGQLDYVFANAGINGVWAPIMELEDDEFDKTMKVNVNGTFHTIKYAVPLLRENGGSIVVTASVNGTRIFSNSGLTAYSTSKAAQIAMTKMLALELAPDSIRVNVICPGATRTDIRMNTTPRNLDKVRFPVEFPKGKFPLKNSQAQAEDIAKLVTFLFSDDAGHITGTEMWVDGGQSTLTGLEHNHGKRDVRT